MSRQAFLRSLLPNLIFALSALPALANSHVRIVRLSTVDGAVKIDRGTGQFEKAIANLPITQGMKLRTGDDGRAEVEFENGSTVRIAPDSSVQFPELSLSDAGTKVSVVEVSKGTAYVESAGGKDDDLTLQFGQEKLGLTRGAHVRLGVDKTGAAMADLKGDLQIQDPAGTIDIKKNQTADFDFSTGTYKLAKRVQQQPEDDWDKEQDQYHQQYASKSSNNYSPYAYGTTDLAYYGNFFNAPGYGMMWQPYFAGAGWDPFMDGAWSFYPGFGFGWVSAYPWGWTPYHYGTWVFLPGNGWAWQPGGAWTPMYTQAAVLNAPAGFVAPKAPTSGTGTIVVGHSSSPATSGFFGSKLVIRNNSAGLGVPRGQFSNMAKLSQKVEQKGVVTQHIAATSASAFGTSESHGGATMHSSSRSSSSRMSEPRQMPSPSVGAASSHASSGTPHK